MSMPRHFSNCTMSETVALRDVPFEQFQVRVRAKVAQGDGSAVQAVLEALLVSEVRGHEGEPEGFSAQRDQVGGHLRVVLSGNHFYGLEDEIGDGIHFAGTIGVVPAVLFKGKGFAYRSIG